MRPWTCVLWIAGAACTSVKTDDTAGGGVVVDPPDDTAAAVDDTGCADPVDLYYDADGDGYGDDALMVSTCDSPAGHVTQGGDCDDIDPLRHPDAEEQCNERDDNCNDEVDEGIEATLWYSDLDGDGYGSDSEELTVSSCEQPESTSDVAGDCDDEDASIHPDAEEVCNGVDDDCDAEADEGLEGDRYYADSDGDGYGDPDIFIDSCLVPADYVLDNKDCDDSDAAISPDSVEVLDGLDNDCNTFVDDLKMDDADIHINGDPDGFGFGHVLSGGADLNGDGAPDLLIGTSSSDAAVIVSGDLASGEYAYDDAMVEISDASTGSMFGSAVTTLNDFNGDGYADLAIGAYGAEMSGGSDSFASVMAGQVYIFFGPMSGSYTAEDADSIHSGPDVGLLGQVVAGGGDLLGTGTSTLILPVYPVSRTPDIVRLLTMGTGDSTAPDVGASVWGPATSSSFGSAVDGSGDVNGDGFADLVVGAPNFTGSTDLNGAIYVFAGPIAEYTTVEDAMSSIEGELSGDALGYSVGGGGDWNDDGFMDIAVGAPGTGGTSGVAYVIEGGASLSSGNISAVATAFLGGMDGKMGSSIALDGDVDGDGHSDVLVGAPHATGEPGSLASVGIFFGGESGVWDATDVAIEPSSPEELAGAAVAYIGDALGLGVDSIGIGGHSASHGEDADVHRVGAVWIFNSGF